MDEQTVPVWFLKLHSDITRSLSRLETGQEEIQSRLASITVATEEHSRHLNEIDRRNAERVYGCPLLSEVKGLTEGLQQKIDSLQATDDKELAAKQEREKWHSGLKPFIYLAALVAIVLAFLHSSDIVKLLQGKLGLLLG